MLAGGSPGTYRGVTGTLGSLVPSIVGSGHLGAGATFNPGYDGMFALLDMSLDGISLNAAAGATGFGMLLEQGRIFFRFGLGQVLNGVGWEARSAAGLTERDFFAMGAAVPSEAYRPP